MALTTKERTDITFGDRVTNAALLGNKDRGVATGSWLDTQDGLPARTTAAELDIATLKGRIGAKVANIAALKALTTDRADEKLYPCNDIGTGVSGLYEYDAGSATAESLPDVVEPTDHTGRFFLKANAGLPAAHASTHITGGADIIATFASGAVGLVPAPTLPGDAAKALLGDATWGTPANAVDADTVDGLHAADFDAAGAAAAAQAAAIAASDPVGSAAAAQAAAIAASDPVGSAAAAQAAAIAASDPVGSAAAAQAAAIAASEPVGTVSTHDALDTAHSSVGKRVLAPVNDFAEGGSFPVNPAVGDRVISKTTAGGHTKGRIYECITINDWTGATETTPMHRAIVTVGSYGAVYIYDQDDTEWCAPRVSNATSGGGHFYNNTGSTLVAGTICRLRQIEDGGARAADVSAHLITGATDTNTDSGTLYCDIVDAGAGDFYLNAYKDATKLSLVAHTATANPDGTTEWDWVADGASGLAGKILVVNAPTAGAFTIRVPLDIEIEAAPTGSSDPLFVLPWDIADGEDDVGCLFGSAFYGKTDGLQPMEVLVQASEDVRIGDILTLSATVAGHAEVAGAGVVIGQATQCVVGGGSAALCEFVRSDKSRVA